MALLAIGDIHGNLRALDDLLGKITPEAGSGDTVVFLGDYIDRGPDTRGCMERILDFQRTCKAEVVALIGNHEQWMLQTWRDHTSHSWFLSMEAIATIESYSREAAARLIEEIENLGPRIIVEHLRLPYDLFFNAVPPEHMAFWSSLKTFFRTPEAVCVHGGLDLTAGPPEVQADEYLVWGGNGFPDEYRGADRIVYGHWNNAMVDGEGWPHPRIIGLTYGLDTIGHGVLTAVRLPDGAVFQSKRCL